MAADPNANAEYWPSTPELEKWLMNTVKDADAGVVFLRRILQMNPAYGQYLSEDKDLASIVQLFAKRVRTKIVQQQTAIQPQQLYEPLCEMTWRVIGTVLHAIVDLQDEPQLPIPKEPLGQVKMLVQTNMELSRKLNAMRRDYLRELSAYRDYQRVISEDAQKTLNSLQEYPVMFFEPLEFVLDDATKEFVRAVVEERAKLEQKSPVKSTEEPKEVAEVHHDEGKEEEVHRAKEQLRDLRAKLAKEQDTNKKLAIDNKQLKDQMEELKKSIQGRGQASGGGSDDALKALQDELAAKNAQME